MTLEHSLVCYPPLHKEICETKISYQVEATTEKRYMVIRGNGMFSRVTKCTGIRARPDLTGMYNYNVLKLIFCFKEFAKKTTNLLRNEWYHTKEQILFVKMIIEF